MKKRVISYIVFIFCILFLINLVSADSAREAGLFVRSIGEWFVNVFSILFNVQTENPIVVLTLFFISIILLLMIYGTLGFMNVFDKNPFLKLLISFCVVGLIVYSVKEDLFIFLLGYSVLGIFILTFVPLIIVFIFSLKLRSVFLARVVWFFFGLYYIILYFYQMNYAGQTSISYLVFSLIGFTMIFLCGYAREKFQKELTEITIDKIRDYSERRAIKISSGSEI